MIRERLILNIKSLCDADAYVVLYLTKKPYSWFYDTEDVSDEEVTDVLFKAFGDYLSHPTDERPHPFSMVYEKVIAGAYLYPLIPQSLYELYEDTYGALAKKVNTLYCGEDHDMVVAILKAFAERDYYELCERYVSLNDLSLSDIIENVDKYSEEIAQNLDSMDLKIIIDFCRG